MRTLLMFVVAGLVSTSVLSQEPAAAKQRTNKLADQSSPYLLLHAHNPVDWYPWGPEALQKAKTENKPIFLSIGYSSCYWCHVMERGVFSNEKIAAYMNEHFVNIKVDREERPDLDDIYMTSLILYNQLTGSRAGGGWPMSMFLLPDGRPFAGGTYFPPEDGPRGDGFHTVAKKVVGLFRDEHSRLDEIADVLTKEVRRAMTPETSEKSVPLEPEMVNAVKTNIARVFDPDYGGIEFNSGRPDGPKFPVPTRLEYLQRDIKDQQSRVMLEKTLDGLVAGGIRDHLGGGFHRYSTDRRWHVPHFEKMLYDQAQLAGVLARGWKQIGKPQYKQAATEVLDYVLRELRDPLGGFYSALDAETNEIEGEYYVWQRKEIAGALGKDTDLFAKVYGLDAKNPFEHGFVLHNPEPMSKAASDLKLTEQALADKLKPMREKLLRLRAQRERPLLDDKVLAGWNGLMIRGLADAAKIFGAKEYQTAAEKAANFVLTSMKDKNGRLYRTWRKDKASLNAYLDDYAFVISGLIALHETSGDKKWLAAAEQLQKTQDSLFSAKESGGYYFTSHDHEELIVRTRNANDAVLPSGNSVSARNLVALARLTGNKQYSERAKGTLTAFASLLKSGSPRVANMATALGEYLATQEPEDKRLSRAGLSPTTLVQSDRRQKVGDTKRGDKPKPAKKKPVEAKAFLSVDRLPAGSRVRVAVYCRIQKNWHINANKPRPDYAYPTKFLVKSKLGTKLVSVKYPKPVVHRVDGEAWDVYHNTIVIHGLLDIPAAAAGKSEELQFIVDYQSCNEVTRVCLRPTKIVLGGKVKVAARGEKVKQINREKFVPPKKTTKPKTPPKKNKK